MEIKDNSRGPVLSKLIDLKYNDSDTGLAICKSAVMKEKNDGTGRFLKISLIDRNCNMEIGYLFDYEIEGDSEMYLKRLSDSLVKVSVTRNSKGFIEIRELFLKDTKDLKNKVKQELIKYSNEPDINIPTELVSYEVLEEVEEDFPEALKYMDYDVYIDYSRDLSNGKRFLLDVLTMLNTAGVDVNKYYKIINPALKMYITKENKPVNKLKYFYSFKRYLDKYIVEDNMQDNFIYLIETLFFNEEPKTLLAYKVKKVIGVLESIKRKEYLDTNLERGDMTEEWAKID